MSLRQTFALVKSFSKSWAQAQGANGQSYLYDYLRPTFMKSTLVDYYLKTKKVVKVFSQEIQMLEKHVVEIWVFLIPRLSQEAGLSRHFVCSFEIDQRVLSISEGECTVLAYGRGIKKGHHSPASWLRQHIKKNPNLYY